MLLNEEDIGVPIVEPAVITRRLLKESGIVEPDTPILWVRLGSSDYECRAAFRCYLGVRVEAGQSVQAGSLLASGGADGEELEDGSQLFTAHRISPTRPPLAESP